MLHFSISWIGLKIFCRRLCEKKKHFRTQSRPLEITTLTIFSFLNTATWLKLIFTATEMWQITAFHIFQKVIFRVFYIQVQIILLQVCIYKRCFSPRTKNVLEFSCILKGAVSRKKFSKQPVTKHLETFLRFNIVPLYHKWNGIRLSSEIECTICLTSCRTRKCLVLCLLSTSKNLEITQGRQQTLVR